MTRHWMIIGRRDSRGFTILELMVVLAIFCVLGAAAAAGISHVTRVNSQQATKYILNDIRRARTEAIKREEFATITFNPANNSYTYTISNTAIARTVFLANRWEGDVFLLPITPGGVDPAPIFTFIFTPRGLARDPFGVPAAGLIYITDRTGFTTNTGKVYRIQAQSAGLIDSQVRDFLVPAWADYR